MCESEQKRHVAAGEWQATGIGGLFICVSLEMRRCTNGQKSIRAGGKRGHQKAVVGRKLG